MRRILLVTVVLFALPAAWTAPAHAHAELRSTDPADGAALPTPPERITLEFTASVEVALASVRVVDGNGTEVEVGSPRHPDGSPRLLSVELPDLVPGSYAVAWRAVSADAHPLQGAFVFQVGSPEPPPANAPDNRVVARRLLAADGDRLVGIAYGAVRAGAFAGLLVFVGATGFVIGVWRDGLAVARVRRLVVAAGLLAAVCTAAAFTLQGPYAGSRPLTDALDPSVLRSVVDTRFGLAMLFRLGLLGAGGLVVWVLFGRGRERRSPALAVVAAVIGFWLLMTPGMAGHAAAADRAALMLASDVVHLAAASFWLGGLAVLALVLIRGSEPRGVDDATARFSNAALVAVVVIIVTGSLQAFEQVRSVDGLTRTTYGRLLLVKVAVVGVMVAVATLSRRWVRRSLGAGPGSRRALGRSVAAEALAGAAVVVVTALLVNAVPGRTALALPFSTTLEARGVVVDVTVDPAKAGTTDVHVYTLEPAGAVKDVRDVTARLSPPGRGTPLSVSLSRAGPGHYSAYGVELPVPGRWRLDLVIRVTETDEVRGRAVVPVR